MHGAVASWAGHVTCLCRPTDSVVSVSKEFSDLCL